MRERFKKTWLCPPDIRLRFQSFFKHFLESWSLVLILGWIWLTSFFSSTRSQAATCGLNRSWTLIRLDTSLGVSRKPGAQHVVSQHILCMVCIYIYKRTYIFVCVYMYVCIYYIIYYAIMCTHDRIFIYTYTHLHMHNRFIFNLIYA